MERIILHIDLDYFYAQIEEIHDQSIQNKSIVICQYSGRTEDSGAVATTNYIARKYGVKSGISIKQAKQLLSGKESVFIAANHELYESISNLVMNIIRKYSSKFEQLSIDEACIDITSIIDGNYEYAKDIAIKIKNEIKQEENLICSVGIGPNKLIAKMAADSNKPNGLTILPPSKVKPFLFPQNVKSLYGVGPKTHSKLKTLKIETIEQLAECNLDVLIKHFGHKFAIYLHLSSSGVDDEPVREKPADQIGRIFTLKEDTKDFTIIKQTIETLSKDVYLQLQEQNLTFKSVGITAILEDMNTCQRTKTFEISHNSLDIIINTSQKLFLSFLNQESKKIRRVGIKVFHFSKNTGQTKLIDFN